MLVVSRLEKNKFINSHWHHMLFACDCRHHSFSNASIRNDGLDDGGLRTNSELAYDIGWCLRTELCGSRIFHGKPRKLI